MTIRSNKKSLKAYRKELRNKSTSAETELWKHLKKRQLGGRKFRRQQSIGNFIVDFYCYSDRLIIELDGYYHGDYIQIEEDNQRDKELSALGFTVIRFENRLVFQDIEWVKQQIIKEFN